MRTPDRVVMLVLAAASAACGIKPRPTGPEAARGTIITAEQIAKTDARTMWEALQRTVRYTDFTESGRGTPERVRRRGASTIVLTEDMRIFVDDVRVADIALLDQMAAADIDHIQVLNGVQATTYYGTNSGDGVILIYTKEGRADTR